MQIGSKAIAEIQRIAASAKPAVEDIGEYFVGVIQRRLSSGQGSTLGWGGGASSYSQGYANRKKGGNTYPVTLIDTGQMVKSIQVLSGRGIRSTPAGRGSKLRGGPRTQFIRAEDASIEIGLPDTAGARSLSPADLAKIHTSGIYSKKPSFKPKPRPFVGLTVQEADEVGRMVAKRIYQAGGTEEQITLSIKFG